MLVKKYGWGCRMKGSWRIAKRKGKIPARSLEKF